MPLDASAVTIRCPACQTGFAKWTVADFKYEHCGFIGRSRNNVLDLRLDTEADSALELDSYDAQHNVSEDSAKSTIKLYKRMFEKYMKIQYTRVLEIGAGTGHLTWGLCNASEFTEAHCSDISLRFMARLHAKLFSNENKKLHSYLFDANDFPFADGMFSAVVGHSVLHHLANFERAIENAYRVLEPGGVAIFGEPMMETHALLSLAARQILVLDESSLEPVLSQKSKLVLTVIGRRSGVATRFLLERPEEVREHEDKFVFPAGYMRDIASKIGFSRFGIEQWAPVRGLGTLIEHQLKRELEWNGAVADDIIPYRPILQAFSDAYEPAMQPFLSQLFAFPIFVK